MPLHALIAAAGGLTVMLLVAGGYMLAARRYPLLWHPVSVFAAVVVISVLVAVLGEVYRSGWTQVPTMARRSAVGGAGWGIVIAVLYGGARWMRARW
jgi:hypothetical protein